MYNGVLPLDGAGKPRSKLSGSLALLAAGYSLGSRILSPNIIPRPLPSQLFDHLQYVNMEAEGLGDLVMCGDKVDRG